MQSLMVLDSKMSEVKIKFNTACKSINITILKHLHANSKNPSQVGRQKNTFSGLTSNIKSNL